jgi:azurin
VPDVPRAQALPAPRCALNCIAAFRGAGAARQPIARNGEADRLKDRGTTAGPDADQGAACRRTGQFRFQTEQGNPPMLLRVLVLATLALFSTPLWAANCAATVEANDAMQFNVSNIDVPQSCKAFTVTLKHTGKLPRNAMGHDFVLTAAADQSAVDQDGIKAGLDNNYVKPGDTRVIAHTKVIGGGETASVTFKPSLLKQGTPYVFFCSFPGHSTIMHGTVTLTRT